MSVLVDRDILAAIETGEIVVDPFNRTCLGTNSYDVHLAPTLLTYKRVHTYNTSYPVPMDVAEPRDVDELEIGLDGLVLQPGRLYLASTVEYTEAHSHVPIINGKSSLGRLGLSIHVTAGTGDVGFCGAWTLELHVVEPLRVRAGMPVGQLLWFEAASSPLMPYDRKPGAKYGSSSRLTPRRPRPSEMWRNFPKSG